MHVDQKQVTTINLLDGKNHDFVIRKDGWGFKLSSVSKDEVVHLVLSANDFHKLRQELAESERMEAKKPTLALPERRENGHLVSPCIFQWSTADWLAFN